MRYSSWPSGVAEQSRVAAGLLGAPAWPREVRLASLKSQLEHWDAQAAAADERLASIQALDARIAALQHVLALYGAASPAVATDAGEAAAAPSARIDDGTAQVRVLLAALLAERDVLDVQQRQWQASWARMQPFVASLAEEWRALTV